VITKTGFSAKAENLDDEQHRARRSRRAAAVTSYGISSHWMIRLRRIIG
jgi:hypothetical protein